MFLLVSGPALAPGPDQIYLRPHDGGGGGQQAGQQEVHPHPERGESGRETDTDNADITLCILRSAAALRTSGGTIYLKRTSYR